MLTTEAFLGDNVDEFLPLGSCEHGGCGEASFHLKNWHHSDDCGYDVREEG